jgi:hypothetical protein
MNTIRLILKEDNQMRDLDEQDKYQTTNEDKY